ncbi:MAG: hypothetical protein EBR09_17220 [Proteobacteria bacterium]|nr:hypothetical protein [Pseudomonadota bacterium]
MLQAPRSGPNDHEQHLAPPPKHCSMPNAVTRWTAILCDLVTDLMESNSVRRHRSRREQLSSRPGVAGRSRVEAVARPRASLRSVQIAGVANVKLGFF